MEFVDPVQKTKSEYKEIVEKISYETVRRTLKKTG